MSALFLIPEYPGAAGWRVWPDPEPIPAGKVQEARDHWFELRDATAPDSAQLFIDDLPLEALRSPDSKTARWRWPLGFYAGTAEARLLPGNGSQYSFEIIADPDARKLTRDDFDTMLREILEDTFALLSLSSFRRGLARGSGNQPPPLARLEFLRSRITELTKVIEAIDRNPRRVLRAEDTAVPYHKATRATGTEILKSFRTGRVLKESSVPSLLPPQLQSCLPQSIRKRSRRSSVDIQEHREIKACLGVWAQWMKAVSNRIADTVPDREDLARVRRLWIRRTRQLARQLDALGSLPMFSEVSDSAPRPNLTAIFRNDPRYRSFMRIYGDMNLGVANVFGDFLQVPIARTFDLYELWAFLRLLRAAAIRYTIPSLNLDSLFCHDSSGVTLASGTLVISIPDAGFALCFQRQYQEYWLETGRRGSFSRPVRPDVAMEPLSGSKWQRLIVLDAKYRINEDLNTALASIHMYRDALVHSGPGNGVEHVVSAAYLISPHVPALAEQWRDTSLPGRLFHPEYRGTFRFGAVTLRPGMPLVDVADTLGVILSDVGS